MERKNCVMRFTVLVFVLFLFQGCATNIAKPTAQPDPTKVRFSQFDAIEMRSVDLDPAYAESRANQKARNKIEEELFAKMRHVFPDLKKVEKGASQEDTGGRVLCIEPSIEAIKFIGGAARFWVGAMAGSSAVRMKVVYRNMSSDEIVAEPVFYKSASALGGA